MMRYRMMQAQAQVCTLCGEVASPYYPAQSELERQLLNMCPSCYTIDALDLDDAEVVERLAFFLTHADLALSTFGEPLDYSQLYTDGHTETVGQYERRGGVVHQVDLMGFSKTNQEHE